MQDLYFPGLVVAKQLWLVLAKHPGFVIALIRKLRKVCFTGKKRKKGYCIYICAEKMKGMEEKERCLHIPERIIHGSIRASGNFRTRYLYTSIKQNQNWNNDQKEKGLWVFEKRKETLIKIKIGTKRKRNREILDAPEYEYEYARLNKNRADCGGTARPMCILPARNLFTNAGPGGFERNWLRVVAPATSAWTGSRPHSHILHITSSSLWNSNGHVRFDDYQRLNWWFPWESASLFEARLFSEWGKERVLSKQLNSRLAPFSSESKVPSSYSWWYFPNLW
jgi:hypothetical protein